MTDSTDLGALDGALSVHEAFELVRQSLPRHPFLWIHRDCIGGPQELTYSQAGCAVDELVRAYRNAGYGEGHHIALLLESRVAFYVHWLALNAIGATLIPIGSELVREEMRVVLVDGRVDLVVCTSSYQEAIQVICEEIEGLRVWVADAESLEIRHIANDNHRPRSPGAAAIVFTSGSTGRPKGCVLSNEYFLTFGRWYRDLGGRCKLSNGSERFITPLPPNHVNALAFSSMGALMTGGCIVPLDRFRSNQWWQLVRESRATVMHYLGVMPSMLLRLPPVPGEREHALRFGIGGGTRGKDHEEFERRFRVPLIEAWAMTETGGAGTISTHTGPRNVGTGCIGQSSPQYSEAKIIDDEGNAVPPGSVGELVVRAAGIDPRRGFFSGYYDDPISTEKAWSDGWLHSGDLARQDLLGSIFFVGRRKQVIRRSGENISAAEVEAALAASPHVLQVVVVPVPDEMREEEVFACVVVESTLPRTMDSAVALVDQAAKYISYYKLPGYVAFIPRVPTTATQKPRYGVIIELAQSMMASSDAAMFDTRDTKRRHRPP